MLIRRSHGRRLLVIAVVLAAISIVCAARILATVVAPGNWGLDRIDQRAGTDNTFTFGATGKGVNLYVIDTGVLGAHVDFQDRRGSTAPRPRHVYRPLLRRRRHAATRFSRDVRG